MGNEVGQLAPKQHPDDHSEVEEEQPQHALAAATGPATLDTIKKNHSLEEIKNVHVGRKHELKSKVASSYLDEGQLKISNPYVEKTFSLDSQITKVPFSVVIQKMDQGLRKTFKELGRQLFEKYQVKDLEDPQWKLHGNGYYVNYQDGFDVCLSTATHFYQGGTWVETKLNSTKSKTYFIYPNEKGILLSSEGIYKGQFFRGKAEGSGEYIDMQSKTKYKGIWKSGQLIGGIIEGAQYKFKGQLQDGLAKGFGAIQFKKNKQTYIGRFQKGMYHDKTGQAEYNTKEYLYKGQFQNGMKHGLGILTEKPRDKVDKKRKFRPPQSFQGEWIEDYYVTTREVRERTRLQKQQAEKDIRNMFDLTMMYKPIPAFDQIRVDALSRSVTSDNRSQIKRQLLGQEKRYNPVVEKQQDKVNSTTKPDYVTEYSVDSEL